jgi:hypothetical protein
VGGWTIFHYHRESYVNAMGQADTKRRSQAALLASRPGCIYCAGATTATTIEHMPPIEIFEGRQRPKGLEFPACKACNNGTGHSDLVASMLARTWPDSGAETQRKDMQKIFRAIANNIPALLSEMNTGRAAEKMARNRHNLSEDVHPLRADGPILTHHILTFAAKLGFALHYDSRGTPIPTAGGAQVMWFSNIQAMNGQIPEELFSLLPSPSTLRQGAKSAADQFKYSYAIGERDHMLYFASFNKGFAVGGITALDRSIFLEARQGRFRIFRPGDFGQTNVP